MDEEAKKAQEAEEAKKAEEQKKADEAKKNQGKTFTQEDLDRVAAERAKRAEEKFQDKLKKEREDWERQAKLSAEEREAEERKKREAETSERERGITLRENRAEARELLQEKSISSDLVDFVVDVDLDKTKENINNLEKAFTKAVETGINDKLKGQTPKEKPITKTTQKLEATRVL